MLRELIKQNAYALITPISVIAAGLVTSLLFTRLIPPFEFGVFSTLVAFTMMLTGITDLGIPNTLVKVVGASFHSNDGHAGFYIRYLLKWKVIALILICSALLLFPTQLSQIFLHTSQFAYVMQVLAILVVLSSISQFITNLFVSTGCFEYQSLINISLNGSKIIFPVLFILLFGPSLTTIIAGIALSFLTTVIASLLLFLLKFKEDLRYTPPKSLKEVNSFFFYSTVLAWASFLIVNVDSVMLNYFRGPEEVAFFGVSSSIVFLLVSLLPISSNFLLPSLVKMEARKEKELQKKLFDASLKYGMLASIPLMFLVYLTANRIIYFFWPQSYMPAAYSLRILSLMLPASFLNTLCASLFISKGRMKELTFNTFISYLFTWVVGAYLIFNYGLAGTAITFVLSNVFESIVLLRFSLGILQMHLNPMHLIKPALASVVIAIFIVLLNSAISSTILLFIISGVLFCVIYLPLMDRDDKKIANALLSFAKLGPIFR